MFASFIFLFCIKQDSPGMLEGGISMIRARKKIPGKNTTTLNVSKDHLSGNTCSITKFGTPGQIGSGVNIHFVRGHTKDLDMIESAGFRFIRMDFVWQNIEREMGVYDWTAYDELTSNLSERGLSAIFILDYSNPLYEESVEFTHQDTGQNGKGTASPSHKESIEAFTRWSAAAALHFKGENIIWELWNEPNVTHFWKPEPDVAEYSILAIVTVKAIRDIVPEAVIIGPATSKIPLPFLELFLASGALEYLDGVSVHPYRDYSKSPETAGSEYSELRELISHYTPEDKKGIPIISSEWGYASATNGVSPEKQAEFIVRMQLANLLYGIPLSIWYDWKNDGDDPGNFEHNCGTVTSDLKPKPAYIAIRTLNMQMDRYTFSHRVPLGNDNDYLLVFRNGGRCRICAWTTGPDHAITVGENIINTREITTTDGYGNSLKPEINQGKLVLELKALPKYISLPGGMDID